MAEASIVIANLVTSERYFKNFEVECWNSGLTTKISGPYSADGQYNPATKKWNQKTPVYFRGLTIGTQYQFRVRIIPIRGQPSGWSNWIQETAGDVTPPSVSYASAVVTATSAGAVVTLNPSTSDTDVDRYEVFQSLTNSTPATNVTIPVNQKSSDGKITLVAFSGSPHFVWARAVDASGNQQAWVSIPGYTPTALDSSGLNLLLDTTIGAGRMGFAAITTSSDGPINLTTPAPNNETWPGVVNIPAAAGPFNFYVRWEGYLIPSVSGQYTIGVNSDDGVNLFVGGQALITNLATGQGANATSLQYTQSGTITLQAGKYYPIIIEWQNGTGPGGIQLIWTPPSSSAALIPSANLSASNTSTTGKLTGTWWNGTSSVWFPQNNVMDWSRVLGAGRPQDFADVTASHISAGISGQGALATQSSADWGSQVSGGGKPENFADVTGNHTAANTSMVGSQAASTIAGVIANGAKLYLSGGGRVFTLTVF